MDRFNAWRRQLELASARRAGGWARRQALETQKRFVLRHWTVLLAGSLIASLSIVPIVWTTSGALQWFAVGAFGAGWTGALWHWVIVASGSASQVMGDIGEQWTHQEILSLRRGGWRVAHQVSLLAKEDVDTIAIGTRGVVVLETKWASKRWSAPSQRQWVDDAAYQVRKNARTVRVFLQPSVGRVPVSAAVILWPVDPDFESPDGPTPVMCGDQLTAWMRSIPDRHLTAEQVESAWERLEKQVRSRDGYEADLSGPHVRSPFRYALDVLAYPLGALVGIYLTALAIATIEWAAGLVTTLALSVAAASLRRTPSARRPSLGAALGAAGLLVADMLARFIIAT